MDNIRRFLKEQETSIKDMGPTRVVVSKEGMAVRPLPAEQDYNIKPVVIFVRSDGWSLGAPEEHRELAERMWRDEWRGVMEMPDGKMEEYK